MDEAMIAGIIAAVSTYAVQTVTYLNPIRSSMSAVTLRSSQWNRSHEETLILDHPTNGRTRTLVIQLQGHLFFGNLAQLTDNIHHLLETPFQPWILIMDFSLVLGIDSSAAQGIVKLKTLLTDKFQLLCIFVSGSSEGFPCQFELSNSLSDIQQLPSEHTSLLLNPAKTKSHVCESLDLAILFAEDALIAIQNPTLLRNDIDMFPTCNKSFNLEQEKDVALQYFVKLCPREACINDVKFLFSKFQREVFKKNDILWKQGTPSDCAMLILRGKLLAVLENEAGTSETINSGNIIGELGLVHGDARMSTVHCLSDEAIVYTISKSSFQNIAELNPKIARFLDLLVIRYLSYRVQHVSNRIFETRCLPI